MTKSAFDYLIALDFEATCDENYAEPTQVQVPRGKGEIIEVPFVVLDTALITLSQMTGSDEPPANPIVHRQQIYVKPEMTPLTSYCTQLTGITSSVLENAVTLKEALDQVDAWIQSNIIDQGKTFAFVTHGMYDLRNMLWIESMAKSFHTQLAEYWWSFFDITSETLKWYHTSTPVELSADLTSDDHSRSCSLKLDIQHEEHPRRYRRRIALHKLCMEMNVQPNGRLHSGLEDATLIARLIIHVLKHASSSSEVLDVLFKEPMSILGERERFVAEEGTVVHVEGLPFRITASQLADALAERGFTDIARLLCLTSTDGQPSGCAYFQFKTHEDAMRFLDNMHGECIQDRCLIVTPATPAEIEMAQDQVGDFPEKFEEQRTQYHTGAEDEAWMCGICKFTNRQARPSCYKCNGANPNPGKSHHRSKDNWTCAVCRAYNYAYRFSCVKCKRPSPNPPSVAKLVKKRQPGDWVCSTPICRAVNYGSRSHCYRCDGDNPVVRQQKQQASARGGLAGAINTSAGKKKAAKESFVVNVGGGFACLSLDDG